MRFLRPTLRLRMALLYGGLVLLVGVSLLFTSIVILNNSISKAFNDAAKANPTNGTSGASGTDLSLGARRRTTRRTTCSAQG